MFLSKQPQLLTWLDLISWDWTEEALKTAAKELLNYDDSGMSVMEMRPLQV